MARAKEVTYYNGRLQGKHLTHNDCDILDRLRALDEENGVVEDLVDGIYDLSEDHIEDVLFNKTAEGIELPIGALRDYQTIGVAYMFYAKRLVLGDSVGVGKTAQAAGLMNLLDKKYKSQGKRNRFLITTDKSVAPQFRRDMVRFTGEYVPLVYSDKKSITEFLSMYPDPDDLPSIVAPSSIFRQPIFQEYLLSAKKQGKYPFNSLIVDESAILANTATQTYKAASKIRDEVDYCVVMNATPFETVLENMYAQLAFVDPTFLPTKTRFTDRYCVKKRVAYGGYAKASGQYKNQKEFKHLVGYRYLARTRRGLGAEMTDCTSELIVTPKSNIQRMILPKTSMPQMVYDNPAYFDKGIEYNHKTTPKAGVIRDALTGDREYEGGWKDARTVLIYSHYKETQFALKKYLEEKNIDVEVMNGDTSNDDRVEVIRRFQNSEFRVLITNVMKGLNFGNTNHVVIYSAPGNVNHLVQFEGRATRGMNIHDKHLLVLVTEGEEEERFQELLSQRAKSSDEFAGSDYSLVLSLLLEKDETDEYLNAVTI